MLTLWSLACIVGLSHGLPQWPGKGGSGSEKWNEGGKAFTQKGTEEMKYNVIEDNQGYQLVRVPASKWVCTSMELSSSEDPYKDWRQIYDNDALQAMNDKNNKAPSSKMFKKLFRYIVGVNSEGKNIEMTAPVTNKILEMDGGDKYRDEMCFWLGSAYDTADPPNPLDDDLFIQNRESMEFFVWKFGGWALSSDDWLREMVKMVASLDGREDAKYNKVFYTVGYDSPFVAEEKRRNEIWMPRSTGSFQLFKQGEGDKAGDDNSKYETMPFETIVNRQTPANTEMREYPAATYACTKMSGVVPSADPMNGWQDKFDNDPLAAMAASKNGQKKDKAPRNKMFMKLFKYILGVNAESAEIEMTTPVPTSHSGTVDLEDQEMCFWLGSPWQASDPPSPIDKDVYVVKRPKMTVFVHRFGGFAYSDSDFRQEYEAFKKKLTDVGAQYSQEKWMHVSYNSPWEMKNRRNEIWIPAL